MARILSKQVQPATAQEGAYANAPAADDGTSKAILFFASLKVSPDVISRVGLCCWNTNLTGGIHAVFGGAPTSEAGCRIRIDDTNGASISDASETIPFGSRYHLLVSAHVDGVNLIVKAAIWNPGTRAWSTVIDASTGTVAGTFLDLGDSPLTILARHTGDSHYFHGGLYRLAMWKSGTGAAIADITSSTVQNYFTNGLATKAKSVAVTGIGSTPYFDFGRDPSEYDFGAHSGSADPFNKFGPDLDPDPIPPEEDEDEPTDTDPPVITGSPVITGDGEIGVEMTASPAAVTGSGILTTTWQWLKNGIEISGATSDAYTPVSGDAGDAISVRQTTTNNYGADTAVSGTVTAFNAPVAPTISGTPTITGSVVEGQTITANAASVSGATPITTTWQWLTVSGNPLTNTATNSTYVLATGDVGEQIFVRQTSTNSEGSDTADSSSYTVASAGSDLTVSIDITSPNSSIAPAIYTFAANVSESITRTPASGSYAPYTDLTYLLATYEWTFSNTETGNYPRRTRIPVAGHAERSTAIGPEVMYCYTTAATHDVTLRVTFPDGRTGTASTQITITDPTSDSVVPSANRMVVSPVSDYTGAPTHDVGNRFTTLQAAWSALSGFASTDVVEVLLDPNNTHTYTSWQGADSLDMSAIGPKQVRIASWTRGTIATIDFPNGGETMFSCDRAGSDIVLKTEDLRMQAPYDMSLESGEILNGLYNQSGNPTEIVVNNCEFQGISVTASAGNDSTGNVVVFNDCEWTEFSDFVLLWPRGSGNAAMIGCTYIAEPDGAVGGRGKQDRFNNSDVKVNRHNFCRVGSDLLYIHSCEIKTQHSWSGGLGGGLTNNPPGRFGRNNPPNMRVVTTRNVKTGAFNSQVKTSNTINPRYTIYDSNYEILSPLDNRAAGLFSGLAVFRNNIVVRHDTPLRSGAKKWTAPFTGGPTKPSADTFNEPVFVIGNTLVDYSTDSNYQAGFTMYNNGGFNHVEEENNVIHRPNLSSPVTANISTTALGFDSWCGPLRFNWVLVDGLTLDATVGPGGTFTIPYSATTTYLEDTWTEVYQLGQADFSAITGGGVSGARDRTSFYYEIAAGVTIQEDTPSVGQITLLNNTGYDIASGDTVRIRFNPIGTTSPQIVHNLSSDLLDGSSVVVDNPNGYTLSAEGGHIRVNLNGDFSFTAESSGLVYTNDSAVSDWPVGMNVGVIIDTVTNPPPDLTVFAHPSGSLSLFRPNAAISAGSDDQLKPLTDFEGEPRIGSNHPNAAGGTYTAGAIDP